jgi:hypothetical protein
MSTIAEACGGGDTGRPLVPGSLRGYRTWWPARRRAWVLDGMLPLTSVTRRQVIWAPTLSARCVPPDPARSGPRSATPLGDHPAPRAGCNCGIYGWYAPDVAGMVDGSVFGAIEASGLILMGERGFRAERARITGVVTRNRRVTAACARAGIAVYRRRRDLLRDLPPEDLSSLLGDRPSCHPGRWWDRWLAGVDQSCWLVAWGVPPYSPPTLPSDPWWTRSRPPH